MDEPGRPSSSARPRGTEGNDDLQPPHASQRIAGEENEPGLIRVMVVKGSSPDKDFEVEVSVSEEEASYALQGPGLPPCMLNEYQASGLDGEGYVLDARLRCGR